MIIRNQTELVTLNGEKKSVLMQFGTISKPAA